MSLRSDANLVRNATQVDPPENNEERIGGLFQDIAKATETVDTIADLRAFDTTDLENGDIVEVRAHNPAGLKRGFGGGKFKWITTPLFSINQVGGINTGVNQDVTVTALQEGFSLPAAGDYVDQRPKIVFGDGTEATLWINSSLSTSTPTVFPEGSTNIDIDSDGAVADGVGAYHRDDNGVWIRPDYVGFDGIGYYERIIEDATVNGEDYGAVPNDSSDAGAINECSDNLQAALDSKWNVDLLGGAYYINKELVCDRGKRVRMSPYYNSESSFEVGRRTKPRDRSQSSLYSTIDINYVRIRCTDLKWFYGIIDTRQAPATSAKAGFIYDFSANVAFSDLYKPLIVGDRDHQKAAADNGITGVLIDIENATSDNSVPNTKGIGSMYYTTVDFVADRIHTGYWVNGEPTEPGYNYFTNSVKVNMISMRNKRTIYMEQRQGSSYFTGFIQVDNALQESQKDWPCVTLVGGDIYYDMFAFDLGDQPDGDGIYRNATATDLTRANVSIGMSASKNRQDSNYLANGWLNGSLTDSQKVLPFKAQPIISNHNNSLAYADLRGATLSIAAYDGTGVDLTTQLTTGADQGLPLASNVSWNDTGLLDITDATGDLEVTFSSGADTTNDFLEVVLTDASNMLWTTEFLALLTFAGQYCNSIQCIVGVEGGTVGQQTITLNEYFDNIQVGNRMFSFNSDDLNGGFNADILILRFIGISELGSYSIKELIVSPDTDGSYVPYIHTKGGQKILGDLEVDTLNVSGSTTTGPTTISYVNPNKRLTRTITSSEILSSNTTPIELLDLEDFAIHPKFIRYSVASGSSNYATNTSLSFRVSTTSETGDYFATIDISDLPNTINDKTKFASINVTDVIKSSNAKLFLETQTGDPTGGDKDIEIVLEYEEVTN